MSGFSNALITGASSGLGRAIALELARGGTRVVLTARREAALDTLATEIRAAGGTADVRVLDVTDVRAVIEIVRGMDAEVGGFDLVLANAGIGAASPAPGLSWEELESSLQVNVVGALATLWAGMGPMVARGRGTLAGMSSLAALRGLPGTGAYCAGKACLSTFLETLRVDLCRTKLRVVDLRPGYVRTEMTAVNEGPMPFLLEVDDAARRCVRALERGTPVFAFPRRAALLVRLISLLPRPLFHRVAGPKASDPVR